MSQERYALNKQLAQMLKGGVIMDVTTPEQAKIAEEAGACAVMALERIPADIRAAGGVSRMSDPKMIKGIQEQSPFRLSATGMWIHRRVQSGLLEETGCDGIMIGRAARGNPWIFSRIRSYLENGTMPG